MRIRCSTLFDCSATGVTGHFRPAEMPFMDRAGNIIQDLAQWNLRRNQQRNWETLQQVIGLRCQLEDIVVPYRWQQQWQFEFSISAAGVLDEHQDFDLLYRDCAGVPMIIGLEEAVTLVPMLCVVGDDRNIWFQTINT